MFLRAFTSRASLLDAFTLRSASSERRVLQRRTFTLTMQIGASLVDSAGPPSLSRHCSLSARLLKARCTRINTSMTSSFSRC